MSESVSVKTPAEAPGKDPLEGKAVLVCLGCGKLLCDPYPTSKKPPKVSACHGDAREDYAPSVRIDRERFAATGERFAVAGEPMAHIRARAGKGT